VKTINTKLYRDLSSTWGQALAIVMVIAAGTSTFIMSISTMDTMVETRDAYYRDFRFEDVFASLNRAPESLRESIEEIPGVDRVETRVIAAAKLTVEGFSEPVFGQVVSVPDYGEPQVNRLYMLRGRNVDPARDDEVILNQVFADAHQFQPGDKLDMIVKGRQQNFTIVGVALSPEFIYQVAPGAIMPDFKRFGVMWMSRDAIGKAYDMDNAFNDVVLTLQAGANAKDVIQKLDLLLEPYGGRDAQEREWQTSHRIFKSDIDQLGQMASMFSTIFLGVAAFLLNIVVSRLINTQREIIAALKAFGYSNIDIGLHYLGYVAIIVLIGLLIGTAAGVWLGQALSNLYMEFYRLPFLEYELRFATVAIALVITLLAAGLGTLFAVNRAVQLPPAQAMQPEPPAKFRKSVIEKTGIGAMLPQMSRMVLRHLSRKPVKAILSVIGIALACAILVMGTFFRDAFEFLIDIEFSLAQREDMIVTFIEPSSRHAYFDLMRVEGVEYGEVFRAVPARLVNGHRSYLTAINGYDKQRDLHRPLNTAHRPIDIPEQGILLTDYLGELLDVDVGDELTIEVLEGRRPVERQKVAGLVSQYFGIGAYMDIYSLNRLMREDDVISGVYLKIDSAYEQPIYNALKNMPRVANFESNRNIIRAFYDTSAEQVYIFVGFIFSLAVIITFGVVYNTARIALSERSRDMASMRVLGFTRAEISYILLGELVIVTLMAIPCGLVLGRLLSWYMIQEIPKEIFRVPLIIENSTYAVSATVVIIASLLSGLAVRTRLDHLDLIAVLKTRE
jgi:putative ABC transport system permease protein